MKKTGVVFEDTTMAYNRWVQGIASRELNATQTPIKDLFDRKRSQLPGATNAPPASHPIRDNTPEIVGNAVLSLSCIQQKLKQALSSNLARDPVKKQRLLLALKHNRSSLDHISKVIKHLEYL